MGSFLSYYLKRSNSSSKAGQYLEYRGNEGNGGLGPLIYDVDSYKTSHYLQFPPGTSYTHLYAESRGGKFDSVLFFGLQYYLQKYLVGKVVSIAEVEAASTFYAKHGVPFNKEGWMYIAKDLNGILPLKIRAVPEGSVIPVKNVLVTIESTDPKAFWLPGWVETSLLRMVWYPTTVATLSKYCRCVIQKYLEETADDISELHFKLHDFGARGVSSFESAGIGGAAHLINFMGSDTVSGVYLANTVYDCEMAGFSIPAAEHSTITAWGRDHEVDAFKNMLQQFAKPGSIVAVVSDSYDLMNAITNIWGGELRQQVIDSGATVVIRPDSGEPVTIVNQTMTILAEKFGVTNNGKGYKVLKNVRVIQGDGINPDSIEAILQNLKENKFSASNIAFGMGGGLLQQVNRDTQQFAIKLSCVQVNGEFRDVCKAPVTDHGKNSRKGKLELYHSEQKGYWTGKRILETNLAPGERLVMQTVYENGQLLQPTNFESVRNLAAPARVGKRK